MNEYFLNVRNLSIKYPMAKDFLREAFGSKEFNSELGESKTPKAMSITNGLSFEFEGGQKLHVHLAQKIGVVKVGDGAPESSWWNELSPFAHAWVGPAIQIAKGIFRIVVGNSVRATTTAAGAGAIGGCVIGTKTKYDYETLDKSCMDGALDGALLVGGLAAFPSVSARIDEALAKGVAPTHAAKYIRGLGLLGAIAAVGFSVPTLATMNGSILRCSGNNGDYILSAQIQGATRHTLYESFGDRLQFYKNKEPGPLTTANEKDLSQLLLRVDTFKGIPSDQLQLVSQQLLLERTKNREICLKRGNGYTESKSFSTERKLVEGLEKSGSSTSTR